MITSLHELTASQMNQSKSGKASAFSKKKKKKLALKEAENIQDESFEIDKDTLTKKK